MSGQQWELGKLTRTRTDGSKYWSYCIVWYEEGQRKRYALGTTDRVAAEATARDFWAKKEVSASDNVGQIMDAYLKSIHDYPSHERKAYAWAAAKGYWGSLGMHQIDDATSLNYHGWRNRSVNTLRYELALIRTGLIWAKDKKLIAEAPKIIVPAMPDSETGHLTKAEFRQFLEGCGMPHVKLFAQLAVTTGARCSALLELPWIRVDLERRLINLNAAGRVQSFNKKRAVVPINDRLYPLLVEAKAGAQSPFVIEYKGGRILSIKKGIALASQRSGIHVTPHMFRHSAAVWMAEERVPMEEIAAYLGHKNTLITARVYARFNPDYLRRAASALDW